MVTTPRRPGRHRILYKRPCIVMVDRGLSTAPVVKFAFLNPKQSLGSKAMAKGRISWAGRDGLPDGGHLAKKGGHDVTVYNRSRAKAAQWVKEYGGKSAATPAEAAKDCDFVMMCVGNDDDVRSVVVWRQRRARRHEEGCDPGRPHDRVGDRCARSARRARRKKASASSTRRSPGGQAGAENGQLGIMCGGEHGRLRQGEAGARRLCQELRPHRRTGRGPAHQDGQPDRRRRRRCRVSPKALTSASAPASTSKR